MNTESKIGNLMEQNLKFLRQVRGAAMEVLERGEK